MWGRTNRLTMLACAVEVSIRVPRGGRDLGNGRPDVVVGISIHLPRVGQDLCKTLKTLSPS